jgi:hypothetical protein
MSQRDGPIRKFSYSGVVRGKADARAFSSGEHLVYKIARVVEHLYSVR